MLRKYQPKIFGLVGAIVALALCISMSSVAFAAKEGPHWKVKGAVLAANAAIKFKNIGVTKLKTTGLVKVEIECKKAEAKAGTANEIIGGSPGTGKSTIAFTECKATKPACTEVKSPGEPNGTIVVAVNTELVYKTEAAGNAEKAPLVVIFRTIKEGVKEFVKIELKGGFGCVTGTVEATGTNKTKTERGAEGIAGVACEVAEKAEEEKVVHTINCPTPPITEYWWWKLATDAKVTKGSVGLEAFGEKAEQIGEGEIELATSEMYSAIGA